ncbi:hypothetical protein M8J76_015285 [Diaphorina citri]|nr:hypothetical protein M8J76_015285 [Diaphorina citri]
MAGRGGASTSRVPRRSNTFDSDIAAANLYKEKSIQPPPLYPTLEYKPASIASTDSSKYLVEMKKKIEKDMRDSNSRLKIVSELEWKLVPSELKMKVTKRKAPRLNINKGKDIDWLKKLEERESIKIKEEQDDMEEDDENAEKKMKIKEEVEDEEEEGEEEVDEDEMMDEGTDYIQNYFDNGEDYIDENDDLDDGPPDKKEEAIETKAEEGGDDIQNVTDALHGTKLGKAQRRREKKENEAREREARIKEQEKENVHGVRNKEIDAIKKILKQNKLMIHEIPSDGNCLYSAILHQLPVCSLSELRMRTANIMMEDPTEYLPYLTSKKTHSMMSPEEFAEYCNALATTPAWGGQVEVRALSQVLKAPIRIVQASGPAILLGEEFSGVKPVTLCYHRHMYKLGAHYNSVKPLVEEEEEEDGGGFVEPK